MELNDLLDFYEQLDTEFEVENNSLDSAKYTNVESNFVYSINYARHRWFNYKEGFSPVLVEREFEEYGIDNSCIVCDPFCGAGTTLAVAKSRGIKAIGFEVNPFAAFITKVKTNNYTEEDVQQYIQLLDKLEDSRSLQNVMMPENEYLKKIFEKEMLVAQLNIREFINGLDECNAKELLFFTWVCTLEECSLYRKAGNGLKIKQRPPYYAKGNAFEYAIGKIRGKAKSIVEDFSLTDNGPIPDVVVDSVTTLHKYVSDGTIDYVLFSPPYANCFDYTKIYYLELWFAGFVNSREDQKAIRMKSLRSHCHATWPPRYTDFYLPELNVQIIPLLRQQKLWTNRIPDMLIGYFADMEEALKQIYKALKKGGHCSIVVSNSAYAGVVIPTDIFLAKIAERIGFHVEKIFVERLIITSSQQYKKTEPFKKYLRESIIKLWK